MLVTVSPTTTLPWVLQLTPEAAYSPPSLRSYPHRHHRLSLFLLSLLIVESTCRTATTQSIAHAAAPSDDTSASFLDSPCFKQSCTVPLFQWPPPPPLQPNQPPPSPSPQSLPDPYTVSQTPDQATTYQATLTGFHSPRGTTYTRLHYVLRLMCAWSRG